MNAKFGYKVNNLLDDLKQKKRGAKAPRFNFICSLNT